MLFFPLILRYPDSFTVNLRFTDDYTTTESIPFESPEHTTVDAEETYSQQYFNESQYEQKQAAEYLRQTAQIIRDEFPSPDEAPVSERNYGGIVSAGGRHESEFSEMLARVTPDPNRFSEAVTEPTLVVHGTDDRLCPVARGRELAADLPKAELFEVEGAGHLAHVEASKVVNDRLQTFLGPT